MRKKKCPREHTLISFLIRFLAGQKVYMHSLFFSEIAVSVIMQHFLTQKTKTFLSALPNNTFLLFNE